MTQNTPTPAPVIRSPHVTSASIGTVAAIIITTALGQICGHPVDLHGLDLYGIGFATFMAVVNHFKQP